MKVYSIGRESGCDIVINDNTDVISRRHAVLNVSPSGKMTIVDQSQNGTYVNGIRISRNVPVPVTRKDNISFAHVARLDWNMVPRQQTAIMRYAAMAVVGLAVVGGVVFGITSMGDKENTEEPKVVSVDSLAKRDSIAKREIAMRDSVVKDSMKKENEKVRREAAKQSKAAADKAEKKKKANNEESKEKKKKADSKKEQPRRIR